MIELVTLVRDAMTSLAGEIAANFPSVPTAIPYIKAGKLRGLGVTMAKRTAALPDVPSIAEAGVPGYETVNWFGLLAPAGTPAAIVERLHKEISTVQNLPDVQKQFDADGATVLRMTPAAFRDYMIADMKKDGTFDNTLIIAMGEFGRTTGPLTQNGGRDHLLQQAALVAGGKVKGGRAIGATNAAGDSVVDPGWSGDRNIWPEDIEATIYSALGIDYTKVIHAPELGRGFYYVPDTDPYTYAPIRELF